MSEQIGTAGFRPMAGISATKAFNDSFFGMVEPGEMYRYVDWHSARGAAVSKDTGIYDRRNELNKVLKDRLYQLKYSGTTSGTGGGAGTAGVAMFPVYVSPIITDRSRKLTPFVEMTSRVANQGITHDFNYTSSKTAAEFKAEGAALSEQDTTRDRSSVAMKYMYSVGRVTGQAIAGMPAYMVSGYGTTTGSGLGGNANNPFGTATAPNAMQLEILDRTRALKELEEDSFWNGDTDDDANEFNGIIDQQADTNDTDKNTTDIDWDDIETATRDAFDDSGFPNVAGCSSAVAQDIRQIVIDHFRYNPRDMATDLPFGVRAALTLETGVGSIPVVPSQYISNTSGSKAIYFLDMTEIYFAVLQDATYEKLAKTDDTEKFMIKQYEALIMRAPQFNSCITEIK